VLTHGLQKYPSLSTRLATTLRRRDGITLIFVSGNGKKRKDGKTNANRMFRTLRTRQPPYFKEVRGPWIETLHATCVVTADVNGDGTDDLILCNNKGEARIFVQSKKGNFRKLNLPDTGNVRGWRNVRVGPILNGGKQDIAVVGAGTDSSYLKIFRSISKPPYFDFRKPAYATRFPHATPDLEFVDVNNDKILDIYVTQADEARGYCGTTSSDLVKKYWGGRVNPDSSYVPPVDKARDVLMVGGKYNGGKFGFRKVKMRHARPGCGGILERFGSYQKLVVAQGREIHLGYNLLLEW